MATKKPYTVEVADVKIKTRLVEFPEKCPHCQADLFDEHHSTLQSYNVMTPVLVDGSFDKRAKQFEGNGAMDYDTATYYATLYVCLECERPVVAGSIEVDE